MRTKICLLLLSCFLFAFDSCKKENKSARSDNTTPAANSSSAPANANQPAATSTGAPPAATVSGEAAAKSLVDACALLTNQEVEAVQKEKVSDTKGSTRTDAGDFASSQCFYTLPTFTNSVSLEVTQRNPTQTDPNTIKQFWKARFQDAIDKKKSDKPKLVAGVGEGAYWVGTNKVGALYVLKNDKILRISIGGADEADAKLNKSKTLAENAVKRL